MSTNESVRDDTDECPDCACKASTHCSYEECRNCGCEFAVERTSVVTPDPLIPWNPETQRYEPIHTTSPGVTP